MEHRLTFAVDSKNDGLKALERVAREFPSRSNPVSIRKLVFADTFDWLAYRDGSCIYWDRTDGHHELTWAELTGRVRYRLRLAGPPGMAEDLPVGPFRRDLQAVIDVRRLLPLVESRIHFRGLDLLDRREKTVSRVILRHGTARAGSGVGPRRMLPVTVQVVPIKGYTTATKRVSRFLSRDLDLPLLADSDLERAVQPVGRFPGDVPASQRYAIKKEMRADRAMKVILAALTETLLRNVNGVKRELDTEFLHDARVAVRRQRSAISQVGGVFDARTTARLKRELSWLGGLTGVARDLDVHLLTMPSHTAMLEPNLRPDLDPLIDLLHDLRRDEQKKVVTGYDSARFSRLVRFLKDVSARPDRSGTRLPNAARPVLDVANERIRKAYKRLIRRGAKINDDSPAEALHRLRIDAKKLRYLLEFFSSLYSGGELKKLVRNLKDLQDNLGEFNDLSIQAQTLRSLTAVLNRRKPECLESVTRGVDALVEGLAERQRTVRQQFSKRFGAFADRTVRVRVSSLVGSRSEKKS